MPVDVAPAVEVVAEVAQAHDGSLGAAHAYIDAVARTGATAVKFQTHIAAAESTRREPWRVPFSRQDATRYDYWKRMEFTEAQWSGLKTHADEVGLAFYSSPFSVEAVDLLSRVGVAGWKIASGEVGNPFLIDAVVRHPKPYVVSTGLASPEELDATVGHLQRTGQPVTVLQCKTAYPAMPEDTGLHMLEFYRQRYGTAVGVSDHSGTIYPGLAAVALGASMIEVHVAFSRDVFGPDTAASLTIDDLGTLVKGVRFLERARAADRPVESDRHQSLRRTFGRSLVASRDLRAGAVLTTADIAYKKPGGGLDATRQTALIGRTLRRDLLLDDPFNESDCE